MLRETKLLTCHNGGNNVNCKEFENLRSERFDRELFLPHKSIPKGISLSLIGSKMVFNGALMQLKCSNLLKSS